MKQLGAAALGKDAPRASGKAAPGGRLLPTGQERVRVLYEEYVKLHWLKEVRRGR